MTTALCAPIAWLWILEGLVVASVQAVIAPVNLYVSPTGSDTTNDGSFANPFQTLARAKLEVQTQKQKPANVNAPINVFLRAGRYALAETLEFGVEDSGLSAQAPVTYQAYCDPAVENAAISDLRKEEDCVEVCTLSCKGCEEVTLSGSTLIPSGSITTWTLSRSLTVGTGTAQQTLNIFQADLTPFLPAPVSPDTQFSFSTLSSPSGQFKCSYAAANAIESPDKVFFDPATFSSKAAQWTNPQSMVLEIAGNEGEIRVGAGGAELSFETFEHGLASTTTSQTSASFRIENVFEELDSPGEWFFDAATKRLYVIPLDSASATPATMAVMTLEFPVLRQLVRASGSRDNQFIQAAHASSSLLETDSRTKASHLQFRHLVFSGTQLRHTDVYERIPGSQWPMARIAAVFLETVDNIVVEHCTFEKIGGNAIIVSGESDRVLLASNNISFVDSSGIAILARRAFRRNAWTAPVLSKLLFSRNANVSFNQIHHFGRRVTHSAAIMAVGAHQAAIQGNLIYHFPNRSSGHRSLAGTNYHIENAHGANYDDSTPLIRTVTPFTIPQTLAQNLATQYKIVVPITGFDVPIIAKLIGAPECPSGTGRIGALYGDPTPFTYMQCSGCCSLHDNFAKFRVAGSGVTWSDATSRQIVVQPGESIELAATSSAFFNSIVDVYVAFHVVTPNQILELPPSTFAKWQILTRKCTYTEHTYTATCSGPCAGIGSTGCGNSNIAIQQNGRALTCDPGYEADVDSHVCTGPFAATSDCDGTGVAQTHVYYNCSVACLTTACV
uniref:Uncharacterized protein n=1 Tax=Globisporangium ultimum (strain ATCC 200006 / CBS 805.95 / DAOM BR144) TaxID=431595 RepID=K3WN16_GLOUD